MITPQSTVLRAIVLAALVVTSLPALSAIALPGMLKPIATSPDGRYLVTSAPFAPYVVWQLPEAEVVFVAPAASYDPNDPLDFYDSEPMQALITNDGWLITSLDAGNGATGLSTQASNIHTGALQTLNHENACYPYASTSGVNFVCVSYLEHWENRGDYWERTVKVQLPEDVLYLENASGNLSYVFGIENGYSDQLDFENIRVFDADTLELSYNIPIGTTDNLAFIAAAGTDHVVWALETGDVFPVGEDEFKRLKLYGISAGNIVALGEVLSAHYYHDDAPQLSADGHYLSGQFVATDGSGEYSVYDLSQQRLIRARGQASTTALWLGAKHLAYRIGEVDAGGAYGVKIAPLFASTKQTTQQYLPFVDLAPYIEQGMRLDQHQRWQVDYQLQGLNRQQGIISPVRGKFSDIRRKHVFFNLQRVAPDMAWYDSSEEPYTLDENSSYRKIRRRSLFLKMGRRNVARWVAVLQLIQYQCRADRQWYANPC